MTPKSVMVVFGTRPEAIKMAPVIRALRRHKNLRTAVTVTGQHRRMLDQVLELFDITPDDDLDVMRPNQELPHLFARIHAGVAEVIARRAPDLILVHGDTTTTLAAALAAFYTKVPIGHVEAGLRTGDMAAPWPEEMNRRLVAPLAHLHFAPTIGARANLLREGVDPRGVHVTGNTVIDALHHAIEKIRSSRSVEHSLATLFPFLNRNKRLILVTGHRRESFGERFENICLAIRDIAARGDTQVVYPVHLNPQVQDPVNRLLTGLKNVHLIAPQDYLPFVYLMSRSHLIITDSGGIQEEAPSLGKPVLVIRETTERPEALAAGTIRLVGTERAAIRSATFRLLDDTATYETMACAINPYGDGKASLRIVRAIADSADHFRTRATL